MDTFVPKGYLMLGDAFRRVVELAKLTKLVDNKKPIKQAGEIVRHLIFDGVVPSKILTNQGSLIDVPSEVWGGDEWGEALRRNTMGFVIRGCHFSGRPLIPEDALKAAFNPDGTLSSKVAPPSDGASGKPDAQYQTRLLGILARMKSEIEASDWQSTPPKKAALVADAIEQFGCSQREAGIIATILIPDNKRGKKKG